MLILTGYKLLMNDWRGYLIAGFALVWIANLYMSIYAFLRIDIKKERIIAQREEEKSQSDGISPGLREPSPPAALRNKT
jgi:hypothetical protein